MKRREFLKDAAGLGAGIAMSQLVPPISEAIASTDADAGEGNAPKLPRRQFGATGIELSIVGFGGIVVMNAEQKQADKVVAEAVEKGVNYFDVAPSYGDAEVKLGPALEPYRKNVFLACKTGMRERDAADKELKRSLKRLRTDHFDLYQLHGLTDLKKDVDAVFSKGGAMETFVAAKKAGVVRHLGFSAHSVQAALAAMDRYDFDSVLFPINFACFHAGNFGPQVIAKAKSKKVARLALKSLARCPWADEDDPERKRFGKCWYHPLSDRAEAALGLRFTLSQPITAAIAPCEEVLFRLAVDLAMNFKPITPNEAKRIKAWAGKVKPIFAYEEEDKPTS